MSAADPRITPSLDQSCFVEASAGTGKTRELVHRIVDVLASGVPVDRIVAVTFTHAAAGEMKLRVREELDNRRRAEMDATVRDHVTTALQTLERAFIGTIHSFCAHLLRQRPVEARIDPAFTELDEQSARRLFSRVFASWIARKLAAPSPALHRAIARLAWVEDRNAGDPIDHIEEAAWKLASWRDQSCVWQKRPFDRNGELQQLIAEAQNLKVPRVSEFVTWVRRLDKSGGLDHDAVEAELLSLPFDEQLSKFRYNPERFPEWTAFREKIDGFRCSADADLASHLRDELWAVVELYEEQKQKAGQLDFLDLLVCARNLLLHDGARGQLQARYHRLFVDEFQDTDPLQAEILLLLSCDDPAQGDWLKARPAAGKLFVVGDPKQSVYRFRRADAKLYEQIRGQLMEGGVATRALQRSHRSTEPIQTFVNAAFSPLLPEYLPLTGGPPHPVGQPSIVALPMPTPFGTRNLSKANIEKCAPDATAAFVEWLLGTKWTVRDPRTQERVPVREEHICILFRRFTDRRVDITLEYARSLEARGLKHVLVGSKSFHRREEVGTLRAALRAIEWPDDALSVYATLHGALFAISDITLLKFKTAHGRIHPFTRFPEDLDPEFDAVKDALTMLRILHSKRNERPLADTLNEVLEHVRAHAAFALRPGGERVLANVYRLADLARNFELSGATSFRSFVELLDEEYESSQASEAPVLEAEAAGVKIMTVHKAKGLEFPVVILADPTCRFTREEGADRYSDPARRLCAQRLSNWAPWELVDHREEESAADRDEALRVAYVAATRARDLLVISAIGAEEYDRGWLWPLNSALYPAKEDWRRCYPAPGCPQFGQSSVLRWPRDGEKECVSPGLHRARSGTHEVVWFDPALLGARPEDRRGINNENLLRATGRLAAENAAVYERWKERRSQTLESGTEPLHRAIRAIDARAAAEAAAIPVEVVALATGVPRARGRRFGILVHEILQHAASIESCARIAEAVGRGLPPEDIRDGVNVAQAIWSHPLIEESRQALRAHREMPVMIQLEDGRLIEGVIDLAWTDGQTWTVVDYKTDSADQTRYKSQIQIYALAVQRATGLPVRAVLLQV
jgi:ATP-dependent helicase/nuclease subunit A